MSLRLISIANEACWRSGIIEPGWLSAQWLTGAFRSKVIPLALFQRKFDEFVDLRERPLIQVSAPREDYGKSELTTFFENPVGWRVKAVWQARGSRDDGKSRNRPRFAGSGDPVPNPNYRFSDLNTDRVTLISGPNPRVPLPKSRRGSISKPKVRNSKSTFPHGRLQRIQHHGEASRHVRCGERPGGVEDEREIGRRECVGGCQGIPDGVVAREIESKLNEKVLKALRARLLDQSDAPGWKPWTSVSEGSTTPGAPVTAVEIGPIASRVVLRRSPWRGLHDGGECSGSGLGPWASVSEGRARRARPSPPWRPVKNRVALFLADPNGGVYTAAGSARHAAWDAGRACRKAAPCPAHTSAPW